MKKEKKGRKRMRKKSDKYHVSDFMIRTSFYERVEEF